MQELSDFKMSSKILLTAVNKPLNNPAKRSEAECTSSEDGLCVSKLLRYRVLWY
jgi:hypothetical protein